MTQFFGRWTGAFLASMLLFGAMSESLPLFHAHEEEHLCIQIDGRFYYGESDAEHLAEDYDGPAVINLVLGQSHDHHVCALCQLSPSFLANAAKSFTFISVDQVVDSTDLVKAAISRNEHTQARGPPVSFRA